MQTGAATIENCTEVPQKIKNGTALWLSESTSGFTFEETQTPISKVYMHLYVHCSIIHKSQEMEAVQVHIDRWVGKEQAVRMHKAILLSHKREWNLVICGSMNGPRGYYVK